MCGLVGALGDLNQEDLYALSFLGTLSALRGEDSTGFMDYRVAGKASPVQYIKSVQGPCQFFSPTGGYIEDFMQKRYKEHKPVLNAVHTRFATVGKVTKANSHPFHHGNILGMHNGTIKSKFDNSDKFETDSEAIFFNLSEGGDEWLKELNGKFDAAYALIWLNLKEQTINFYRNEQRPLFFQVHGEKLFWASDKNWLDAVLSYFRVYGQVGSIPIDQKITFDLTAPASKILASRKQKEIKQSFFHSFKKAEDTGTGGTKTYDPDTEKTWYPEFNRRLTLDEYDALVANRKQITGPVANNRGALNAPWASEKKLKHFTGSSGTKYYNIINHLFVTEDLYREMLDAGCRGCLRNKEVPLDEEVEFITKDAYLCEKCKSEDYTKQMVLDEIKEENGKPKEEVEHTCH